MKWQKAPEELKAALERAVQGTACEKRMMFGFPVCFTNGHMFLGLFESQVFIRLSDQLRAALETRTGPLRHLEPMPGRPMKEYFVLPASFYSSEKDFAALIADAAAHAKGLPAKAKKPGPRNGPSKSPRR
jgi:TfoX/Sxy family transcriptional regulator of competence genes